MTLLERETVRAPAAGWPGPAGSLGGLLDVPGTRTLVLSGSKDPHPKVTVLVVPPGQEQPTLALKVATTPAAGQAVRREAAVLRSLHGLGRSVVHETVPRCLDLLEVDGLPVLVATVLPGRPLAVDYHRWRHTARPSKVGAELRAVTAWLTRVQAVGSGPERPLGATACELALGWAAREPDDRLQVEVTRLRERLGQHGVAGTLVHGDLWCGNVLTGDGSVTGVVDWEAGSIGGEPLRDHVRLVLSHALYLDRHTRPGRRVAGHPGLRAGPWGEGVRYALLGTGWYPDAVRLLLQEALLRHRLPPRLWYDLALSGLAEAGAVADHPDFAAHHRALLLDLATRHPRTSR